ncbi:MAG: phosphonate C-P lyase system protein PhnH [Cyanobacteria bacterium J06626_6]
MPTTLLPGFSDLTQDSQKTFRALLAALSSPGDVRDIAVEMVHPEGLTASCAAACLALIDFETTVWLQPAVPSAVSDWLRFHTGCAFTEEPERANFAIVSNPDVLCLDCFSWGSAEAPELSATVLIQVEGWQHGPNVVLRGPGVLSSRSISPAVSLAFWQQWRENHRAYPRGVDCFLFAEQQVMGLPRSAQAQLSEEVSG